MSMMEHKLEPRLLHPKTNALKVGKGVFIWLICPKEAEVSAQGPRRHYRIMEFYKSGENSQAQS